MDAMESNAPPLDLLYVITDLNLGGVPLHLHRLAAAMRDRGMSVAVVSLAAPGPVADRLTADRIAVYSCDACCGWDFRVISRLSDLIRTLQPSLIHSFLFHANLAAKFAAQTIGFPASRLICEIQTVEIERKWHLWVDRRTFDLCLWTVANSPSVFEHLRDRAGIPIGYLRHFRGGIDPIPLRCAVPTDRSALGLPVQGKMIFWAGRLDPVKGLGILIDAVTMLNDPLVHLVLAGDGPLRSSLQAQVDAANLTSRVHFLGPRHDVPSLLKACDVFAFPSRTEGLPNALLEAMAAGCAIVATEVSGNKDLITHDRTGLLVPYGDPVSLSRAIRTLLVDVSLARRLGGQAASVASAQWRRDQMLDTYYWAYCAAELRPSMGQPIFTRATNAVDR